MSASADDFFHKVGRSTATTLSAPGYTIGDTSINVASTTNWPTSTGVTFAIDETDADGNRVSGTYNVFRGTVSGATQVNNLTYVGGDANRNYAAAATTRVYILVSAYRDNRFADGVLVEHNQDGTHSDVTATTVTTSGNIQTTAGAVITDTISEDTAANGVAIDGMTIKDGKVVGGSAVGVANSSLDTTAGELGGAWQSWTPTITGFSANPASGIYKYTQIGKTVFINIRQPNAGTSNATTFTITLPVNANSTSSYTWATTARVENAGTTAITRMAYIDSGDDKVQFGVDGTTTGGFTASGNKRCWNLEMFYEAA